MNKVRKSKDNMCEVIKGLNEVMLTNEVLANNRWKDYFLGGGV